jgi:hypothetical protein
MLRCRRSPQSDGVLDPRERLAFLGNLNALFRSGVLHGDAYLAHLVRFANDADPHVLGSVVGALAQVRVTFDSAEARPKFAAYVRRTLGPALQRIGLDPSKDASQSVTILRPQLVSWLARYGDEPSVWAFVKEQLPKYLQDSSSVHPTLAGLVVGLSAERGDEALFEEYKKRFENAAIPAERARFLGALGQFRNPAVKAKVREYALAGPVRPTDFFQLLGGAETSEDREELYQWVTANYDAIMKKLRHGRRASMRLRRRRLRARARRASAQVLRRAQSRGQRADARARRRVGERVRRAAHPRNDRGDEVPRGVTFGVRGQRRRFSNAWQERSTSALAATFESGSVASA